MDLLSRLKSRMTNIRELFSNNTKILKIFAYCLITVTSSFFLAKGYVYLVLNGYIELIDPASFFLFPIFFYLFAIVVSFVFKNYLSSYGVFFINFIATLVFFLYALSILNFFYIENKVMSVCAFNWFQLAENQSIGFDFFVDYISFSFILLTITIAFFVNIYTFSYFRYEPYICRLISLINAFVLSMIILVSAGNLVVFFFGWEMIGLTSFFLINFWSERAGTFKSAFKAFAFNKVSDAAVLISLLLIFAIFNDLSFNTIFNLILFKPELKTQTMSIFKVWDVLSFFLILAACIKSAQIGFHIWLPDSMEAPVPASALIHSATLVSAGVYLILRFYPLLELSQLFHISLPAIGAFTAFVGGASAAFQTDLKKILAYSTISHCGFLMFLASFGAFKFVLLYLFVHGFFKAAAFLCVGNIIHHIKNYQDLRRSGEVYKYLPVEFLFLIFCLLNLSGLPFFFGFYIKSLLFLNNDLFIFDQVCLAFIFVSCLTGIVYSFNIVYFAFFDFKKANKSVYLAFSIENFKSFFFTGAAAITAIAIFFLIITACLLTGFLYYFLILNLTDFVDFSFFLEKNYTFFINIFELGNLFNLGFFYWVSLTLIFILILISFCKRVYVIYNGVLDFFDLICLCGYF